MLLSILNFILMSNVSFGATNTSLVDDYYGCPNSSYLCEALSENLERDNVGCRVSPRQVASLGLYMDQQGDKDRYKTVNGRIRYFGPFTGSYSYHLIREQKKFRLSAKVYFKNLSQYSKSEINNYKNKIKQAASIWNQNNPFKNAYTFDFQLTENRNESTIAPELIRQNTRGPYFTRWSLRWDKYTIAHEFGHILGLFDEYSYSDSSNPNCDSRSIMCSSGRGVPLHYHYHLIFQRPFCSVN